MKGQISRDSYRPTERYAGVFHIQGGMVTDADLDERTRIVTARTDLLGDDTIKDGVPATGGAVAIDGAGNLSLREGVIYADGVRGVLAATEGANLAAPLALFTEQADLPLGPALPAADSVVYADIWERAVFALEDPYLADAGLHGAETAFRSRTMVQLKAAPLAATPDIEAGTGDFPRIGTAELAIAPTDPDAIVDECDPCAGVVQLEQVVANALWRLEVVAVEGTPTAPDRIALAWSIENAAAIAPADVSHEDFERAGKVYEFFSPTTESYSGVFADSTDAKPSAFVDDLATAPNPPTDYGGDDWPFVRRWDGHAVIDPTGGAIAGQLGAGFTIAVAAGVVTLTLDTFTATLDLAGKAVMAGDYWLVELRRFAAEDERIRLVSATPVGIEHHYCVLFRTNAAGAALPPTDAERRKLSFPTLADLPADHVGFVNNCPKLYDDAENVQEALDNLCAIAAEDIAFDPDTCPVLYNGATNVQDALANLCKVDFSFDRVLRLLMDWGVVCGLVPKLEKAGTGVVSVSPGSFLDRAGHLYEFKGGDIDLDKLKFGENILYKDEGALAEAFKKETVCLAVAAGKEGGNVEVFVADKSVAFGPADPGFLERAAACVKANKPLGVKDRYTALKESDQKTASRMMYVVSNSQSFFANSKLTVQEAQQARGFNETLFADFSEIAPDEDSVALKSDWARIDEEVRVDDVRGAALDIRRMQRESLKLAALLERDQERMRRCLCEAIFPTCPPSIGKPPYLVPIACLKGFWDGSFIVNEVCPFCCRKQAMTWRAVQYFVGPLRSRLSTALERLCCGPRDGEPPRTGIDPKFTYNPDLYAQPTYAAMVKEFGLAETILDAPPRAVTDIKVTVPVNDLAVDEARKAMAGNGIEVVEVVDMKDAAAFDRIAARTVAMDASDRLIDKNAVRPGDKVVLIVQDGVARDYVPVERGSGKYLFETEKRTIVAEEDVKRVAELTAAADAARAELGQLEGQRETLTTNLSTLRADVETLARTREETATALVSTSEVLKSLIEEQRLATERIAAANKELEIAEASRNRIVTSLRGNQPATMLTGDRPDLAARLAAQGIFTVSDIAGLSAVKIRDLTAAGILDRDAAANLKKTAQTFLDRPIV